MELVERKYFGVSGWCVREWQERGIFHGFLGQGIDVKTSRDEFSNVFGDDAGCQLQLLQQVHGIDVLDVADSFELQPQGDAWISRKANGEFDRRILGIKTADCFPVLLTSSHSECIAAVHCGWRSSVSGILFSVLDKLQARNVSLQDIEVAIGPGAQCCCFEVGEDVFGEFHRPENRGSDCIVERAGKFFADIPQLLRWQLLSRGVKSENVAISKICSICSDELFSFRREKDSAGRQISFIANYLQ